MIKRALFKPVVDLAKQYPVVTITGPRQSGKTTLSRECFKEYKYLNLEDLNLREFASLDPKGFLSQAPKMVIDEIQRVPELASYIQVFVDESKKNGQFILTGSHQLALSKSVSQSLAGRTALINLLPFSIKELDEDLSLDSLIYRGFYPRIIDQKLNPTQAQSFYVKTYLEKDLRELQEIRNLKAFESFLKLCASNIGQLLNKSRLSNDLGVDAKTIESWLSILEASFVIYRLQPHYKNFRKRLTKQSKLYFYDVGLASYLLGIKNKEQVSSHPLRGSLFENLVITEKMKLLLNKVQEPSFYFFRDHIGNEVDLIEDLGEKVLSYEIKASQSLSKNLFKGLEFYSKLNPSNTRSSLIYSGDEKGQMYGHHYSSYKDL